MKCFVIKGKFYHYYPNYFSGIQFDEVYEELKEKCHNYTNIVEGKEYISKRLTCTFSGTNIHQNAGSKFFSYDFLKNFSWEESSIVDYIRKHLERKLNTKFLYCLAHIYPGDGKSNIPWHSDRESGKGDVVSVSFGVTRKFRFRKIGQSQGWIKEFYLSNGDVFHMLENCQNELQHTIPVESKVREPRINLTFRKAKY